MNFKHAMRKHAGRPRQHRNRRATIQGEGAHHVGALALLLACITGAPGNKRDKDHAAAGYVGKFGHCSEVAVEVPQHLIRILPREAPRDRVRKVELHHIANRVLRNAMAQSQKSFAKSADGLPTHARYDAERLHREHRKDRQHEPAMVAG